MTTFNKLLESVKEIWDSYNKHPFVMGIQDGTLSREKFRYYVVQDLLYLEEYTKVFALGIAKANDIGIAKMLAKYIDTMNGEFNIHNEYMWSFDITDEELKSAKRSFNNISYTSYMLRIAYEEGVAEILTAVLACAYSYEFIAKNIVRNNSDSLDGQFYSEWIAGYASYEYSGDNIILINTLNRLTKNYTDAQIDHLKDIFTICSKYEYAFWETSWNMGK